MGICTSLVAIKTPLHQENIAKATLVYAESAKKEIVDINIKTIGKTIVYVNQACVHWSIGYVIKIENNMVYVFDKYTKKLNKFNVESAALNWNNYPIGNYNPRIDDGKTLPLLTIYSDKNKIYNDGKQYINDGVYSGQLIIEVSDNMGDLFSDTSYTFDNKPSIDIKELYLGNKIIFCLRFKYTGKPLYQCLTTGIIYSISNKYLSFLINFRGIITLVEIPRLFLDRIYKFDPETKMGLFTTVTVNNTQGVIIDIINDKAKVTNQEELVNISDCVPVDISYEESIPYFKNEKTAPVINYKKN